MDHELVFFLVKCGSRLKSADVASMADFSLSVAAEDVKLGGFREPDLSLLVCTESPKGFSEHAGVEAER